MKLKLSSQVREVIEGYVAGLNYWVDLHPNRDYQALFPITKYDIVSGFVIQNLFFSGVVSAIEKLQSMEAPVSKRIAMNQNNIHPICRFSAWIKCFCSWPY